MQDHFIKYSFCDSSLQSIPFLSWYRLSLHTASISISFLLYLLWITAPYHTGVQNKMLFVIAETNQNISVQVKKTPELPILVLQGRKCFVELFIV